MKKNSATKSGLKTLAASLSLLLAAPVLAGGSGEHSHDHAAMKHAGSHQHSKWVTPPAAYAKRKSQVWTDAAAAARGKKLYAANCASCHGDDGTGSGPLASSLPHAPADLTHHFHKAPGQGDAYLFWRVSEGGQVEPFKSMKSAMPSFKGTLSEAQRWDVLAYVHQQFHKGFKNRKAAKASHHESDEHAHHH